MRLRRRGYGMGAWRLWGWRWRWRGSSGRLLGLLLLVLGLRGGRCGLRAQRLGLLLMRLMLRRIGGCGERAGMVRLGGRLLWLLLIGLRGLNWGCLCWMPNVVNRVSRGVL